MGGASFHSVHGGASRLSEHAGSGCHARTDPSRSVPLLEGASRILLPTPVATACLMCADRYWCVAAERSFSKRPTTRAARVMIRGGARGGSSFVGPRTTAEGALRSPAGSTQLPARRRGGEQDTSSYLHGLAMHAVERRASHLKDALSESSISAGVAVAEPRGVLCTRKIVRGERGLGGSVSPPALKLAAGAARVLVFNILEDLVVSFDSHRVVAKALPTDRWRPARRHDGISRAHVQA